MERPHWKQAIIGIFPYSEVIGGFEHPVKLVYLKHKLTEPQKIALEKTLAGIPARYEIVDASIIESQARNNHTILFNHTRHPNS